MGGWVTPATPFAEAAEEHRKHRREDEVALRNKTADDLENAIKNIQANPNLSPQEKTFQIDQARKKLQELYQPHEGPELFQRLKKIFGGKEKSTSGQSATLPGAPAVSAGGVTVPATPSTQVELKPGLTIGEVLAAGSPAAPAPHVVTPQPFKAADGKWYVITEDQQGNMARKEVPYSEQSRIDYFKGLGLDDEEAKKAVRIEAGIQAKPVARTKGLKYDKDTDTVLDQDTGERWARGDANMPEEAKELFAGHERVEKHREEIAGQRFHERLQLQQNAFNIAIEKGDHAKAKSIVNEVTKENLLARMRLATMERNREAARRGDQQAMLSLVANHIGMTLGAQRGARITRAVWDEAMESAPWLDVKLSRFFHQDANGDYIFDGWKEGVTLTPEQIDQMVDLARDKVDVLNEELIQTKETFDEDLNAGREPEKKPGGEKKTHHFVEGNDSWDIPDEKLASFKAKHPNAKEQ